MFSVFVRCIPCRNALKKIWQDRGGFTLLELLIALSVWALLLPVLAGSLVFIVQAYQISVDRLEASEQVLSVLRNVEGEIQSGHDFLIQSNGVSFFDANHVRIQYQLSVNTGFLQRSVGGVSTSIIGATLTVFECRLVPLPLAGDSSRPPLEVLSLHIRTQSGRAVVDVRESLTGRNAAP